MEDREIIRLYQQRDEKAILKTAEKYESYMNTIAYNVLRNKQDTEECVQDAYLKVWKAIPPALPQSLRAFIGKIVKNVALDKVDRMTADKRGGTEIPLVYEELSELVTDKSEEPDSGDLTEAIDEWLDGLKAEQRRIFVLRYWGFYSVKDISKKLRIGESKVKTSLSRSRNSLKKYLAQKGY